MATIKYLIQSKSNSVQIYLRLSISQKSSFKRKTGLVIDSKDWSKISGFPKSNSPENKNLKVELKNLESFILKEYNVSFSNKINISSEWLKNSISKFFGNQENEDLDYLITYTDRFIIRSKNITSSKGNRGISEATIKKRTTVLNKLRRFEEVNKTRLKIRDVDLDFREKFIEFLENHENLNGNTIGKYLKIVKTICLDAQKNGVEINSKLIHFKGFSTETFWVTLSFEELKQIEKASLNDKQLIIARDWLIIGCYTGQRGSDLLRMNSEMIQTVSNFKFITLTQSKGQKLVQIPIHSKVKEVLKRNKDNFPPIFSKSNASNLTLFNKNLKKLCEKAGIIELAKGTLMNPDSGKSEVKMYPKYKLISSHICRRSFATNFYALEKYPTPLLMNITGHSTEKMFLAYIGKKPIDYSLRLAKIWEKE